MNIKGFQLLEDKLRELGSVLLDLPAYQEHRQAIRQFEGDSDAQTQYEHFIGLQQEKDARDRQGIATSPRELEFYHHEEMALYANAVIRKYLYARTELEHLQQSVSDYFTKTVQLGRLPQSKEMVKFNHGCGTHYERTH